MPAIHPPTTPSPRDKTLSTITSQVDVIASYYQTLGIDLIQAVQIRTCRRATQFGCSFAIAAAAADCHSLSVTRTGASGLAALRACTTKVLSVLARRDARVVASVEAGLRAGARRGRGRSSAAMQVVELQERASCVASQEWFVTVEDEVDAVGDVWMGLMDLEVVEVGVGVERAVEDELVAIWNAAMSL